MRKIAIGIAAALFLTPFFWLKPGFVNIGGDGGRLYFLDPAAVLQNTWNFPGSYVYSYANIGYLFFQSFIARIIQTPTHRIAIEHGLQLAVSFLGIFFIVNKLLSNSGKKFNYQKGFLVSIVAGITYVALITKIGWSVALVTLNQVFLNPVIFYLLLRYCMTGKLVYTLAVLFFTAIFSANFGFTSAPQVLSFFPLSLVFLYIYMKYVIHNKIPWRGLLTGAGLFLGLHSIHLLPVIASLFTKDSTINSQVFSQNGIVVRGADYFVANRIELGKMSVELFQPWLSQNLFALVIPVVSLLGFFNRKSKLLSIMGIFFAVTLFLVSANITQTGVNLYQKLFYIPGFVMFRSFNEKWYFAFAFYYVLMFAVSLYYLLEKRKPWSTIIVCAALFAMTVFRLMPFLSGKTIQATVDQSRNVSTIFSIDPDLLDALSFVRNLPVDGKVLTLPLTYTYLQIAYGKEGGAYVGISMVSNLAGRPDFAGLWSLEPYRQQILSAMRDNNTERLIQLLAYFNIRYIFYNSDNRPMDNISRYYDPAFADRESEIPSLIKDQLGYSRLLASLPMKKLYQKGFYYVYELDNRVVRPLIYLPDDPLGISSVSYIRRSPVFYDISIDLKGKKSPFLLVLSNNYYSAWDFTFEDTKEKVSANHVVANGFANGWIIDPGKIKKTTVLHGHIYLTSQNIFYAGGVISGITLLVILYLAQKEIFWRKHETK